MSECDDGLIKAGSSKPLSFNDINWNVATKIVTDGIDRALEERNTIGEPWEDEEYYPCSICGNDPCACCTDCHMTPCECDTGEDIPGPSKSTMGLMLKNQE